MRIAALVCVVVLGASILAFAYSSIPGVSAILSLREFLSSCPSDEELSILEGDFPLFYLSADGQLNDAPHECLESQTEVTLPTAIYQALRIVRRMRLTQPLPWTGLHPYEWLKEKIGAVVIDPGAQNSYCCGQVWSDGEETPRTAIVLRDLESTMSSHWSSWINPQAGVGLAGLLGLIFHEARHVDVPHTCGNDDATLEEMGAWGVQYTIFARMGDGRIDVGMSNQQAARTVDYANTALGRICE